MRKPIFTLLVIIILVSCSKDDKLLKDLAITINREDKTVMIDNFPSINYYGSPGFSSYSTLENSSYFFKELDRKLYYLLLNENGIYELNIRMNPIKEDKYGNKIIDSKWFPFGYIDCSQIRKYKNFDYWSQKHTVYDSKIVNSNVEYLYHSREAIIR